MTAPTPEELAQAIATIEDCRRIHVDWAEWQEATPDWQAQVRPTDPGEPDHHRLWVSNYDQVLDVLRRCADLAPVP